jgi:sugar diacid utilization regulator
VLRTAVPYGPRLTRFGGRTQIPDSDFDALVRWQNSREGQVAFGEPAPGNAGFAASHHQALEARTIAVATSQHAVRFADVRLLSALLRDGDLAKEFIERELGELDDPSERMRERRETLRAYLEHGQSVSATAAVRRRDRKTIERQLRSAELLIHHRVSDRCDELLIALRIAAILRHRDQT